MAWYKTGSVTVTNGSTLVTGVGCLWSLNVKPGDGFYGPDGKLYEIASLDVTLPNTKLYLVENYAGSTLATQAYKIVSFSTVAISTTTLAQQVSALLNSWQGREDEFRVWQAGSATAGYDIDGVAATGATAGYYPMTDPQGVTSYVACPAKYLALTSPIAGPGSAQAFSVGALTAASIVVPAWTNVAGGVGFVNSWVDYNESVYGATAFYKDPTGRVHLRIAVKSGTAVGTLIFTLPVGCRPGKSVFATGIGGAATFAAVLIGADGTVASNVGASTASLFVNVSFLAE